VDGRCICDDMACQIGCCQGDTCVTTDQQSFSLCGQYGSWCMQCPAGTLCQPGGCTCEGRLLCGAGSIATGANHSCGVTASTQVRCWGDDQYGQLGLVAPNSGTDQQGPATIPMFADFDEVTAGDAFTCAMSNGFPSCWGDTPQGSLTQPEPVSAIGAVDHIAAGARHACALNQFGIWCWGDNTSGQVGPSSLGTTVTLPNRVTDGGRTQVAPGARHTCALAGDSVECWGHFLDAGTTPFDSDGPKTITGLSGVRAIASGDGLSCAATDAGVVTCFGKTPFTTQPIDATSLCVGGNFACAATTAGSIECWGDNALGQLGHPDSGALSEVLNVADAMSIACGRTHACAVIANHQVACWGDGAHYKLGNASTGPQPAAVLISD
jgi:alpha-tubulin suppressor-like RCC1 family protein